MLAAKRSLTHRTASCSQAGLHRAPGLARRAPRPSALPDVLATWSRPTPDRNEDWVKPSYVPQRETQPAIQPWRQDEPQPLYAPSAPEFQPAELPEKAKEMPQGPAMPERRPDPIPAGNPKEKPPGEGVDTTREAPPAPKKD